MMDALACEDLIALSQQTRTSLTRTASKLEAGLAVLRQKETSQQCVPSLTSPLEESSEERWEDERAERVQEVAKDRRVDTGQEKGEVRCGGDTKNNPEICRQRSSVQVKVPPQRKQPPLIEASGSDAWRATPPTRMFIRNEEAASVIRQRIPPFSRTSESHYVGQSDSQCAASQNIWT